MSKMPENIHETSLLQHPPTKDSVDQAQKKEGGIHNKVQPTVEGYKFPHPPKWLASDVEKERAFKLGKLACAFRIFAKYELDLGVAGHLTLRDPEHPQKFWVNPFGVPFAHMCVSDLLLIDHQGKICAGGRPDGQFYNQAAFTIHAQVHEARPDVNAVCHSHSTYGKAFSTLGKELDMITQDTCMFYNDAPLYPNFGGVVLAEEEGKHIAKYLGDKKSVILQNHGLLTAGETVEEATVWFIQLEAACKTQLLADAAGKTVKIGEDEAQFTYDTTGNHAAGWFQGQPYFKVMERLTNGSHLE